MSDTRRSLPYSNECFICGAENAAGLRTRFYSQGDQVLMPLTAGPQHCGYHQTVHGGILAAALDECMGWAAARVIQRMCVTGDLRVRYVQPVRLGRQYTVVGEVERANKRIAYTLGKIVDETGALYARAEAKFLPLSVEETLRVDDHLRYDGDEERVFDQLRAAPPGAEGG